MAHEIAGDVISFDDLKENTSCPYITVSSHVLEDEII